MTHQDELKQLAGEAAVQFIEDGMVVGLGTGSTMKFMVNALGERVKKEHLSIVGVPTSERTKEQAHSLGIQTKAINEIDHIDLTIDGADQIDPDYQGIKGAVRQLWEKLVAINSPKTSGSLTKLKWPTNWDHFLFHLKSSPTAAIFFSAD